MVGKGPRSRSRSRSRSRCYSLWTRRLVLCLTGCCSSGPVAPLPVLFQQCHGSPQRRSSSRPSRCPSTPPADSRGVGRRCDQQHTRCLPCGHSFDSKTRRGKDDHGRFGCYLFWVFFFCHLVDYTFSLHCRNKQAMDPFIRNSGLHNYNLLFNCCWT